MMNQIFYPFIYFCGDTLSDLVVLFGIFVLIFAFMYLIID